MARVRVRTHGFRRAIDEVSELPVETADGARAALRDWARNTRSDARKLVPERTGNLRRDIVTRTSRKGLNAKVGVWAEDAFYAIFVEFGTSDTPADPFLLPAFESNRPGIEADAGREIRRRVT